MKTNRKTKHEECAFHYYGSTAYDWITGPSREYVAKRLAACAGSMLTTAVKRGSGIEAVICKVLLPQEATYTIRNYVPFEITERKAEGEKLERTGRKVPLREYERVLLVGKQGQTRPNPNVPPNPTDEELAEEDAMTIPAGCWY